MDEEPMEDESESFFTDVEVEMTMIKLKNLVSSLSPVQLASAGIIVKKVTSMKNDFRKFGIETLDSTTVVVEIALHYEGESEETEGPN